MVLDQDIVAAVITGQIDAVKAWLAADQSRVNDFATFPGSDMKFTLLAIAATGMRDEAKLPLVRLLLAHGVTAPRGTTPPSNFSSSSATMALCGESSSSGKRRGKRGE